ncbi:hypothetical protein Tcan_00868, partial [Toxocara canis]
MESLHSRKKIYEIKIVLIEHRRGRQIAQQKSLTDYLKSIWRCEHITRRGWHPLEACFGGYYSLVYEMLDRFIVVTSGCAWAAFNVSLLSRCTAASFFLTLAYCL